jgi:hypothetical protein
MGLKMNKLTHLKALCERATKGPWINTHIFDGEEVITALQDSPTPPYVATAHGRRDAEFIAACNPETILKLLSIIEIQGKALEAFIGRWDFDPTKTQNYCFFCDVNADGVTVDHESDCEVIIAKEALTAVDGILGE